MVSSSVLLSLLVDYGFPASVPAISSFNATEHLLDANINPGQLTISRRKPSYIGPALAQTWDNLGNLYKVIIYENYSIYFCIDDQFLCSYNFVPVLCTRKILS
jgi:hypothetical protein